MERGWIEWPVDPVNESEEKISRKEWRFRSGNESRWPRTSAVPLQSGNPAQSDSLALPARLKNRARGYQISSSLPSSVLSLGWTFARIYPAASSNDHLSNDSPLTPSFSSKFLKSKSKDESSSIYAVMEIQKNCRKFEKKIYCF